MKNLTLGFLVFITTFLNAQSVDPETFPTVVGAISGKNLYTNTGGEGKISIQSIVDSAKLISGDFIPLTGTTVGNPVTGSIEYVGTGYDVGLNQTYADFLNTISFRQDEGVYISSTNGNTSDQSNISVAETFVAVNAVGTSFIVSDQEVQVSNGASGKGITSTTDYTANITDLDYTQKIYVDKKVAKIGADDIEITDFNKGIILTSPNSSRYRITVDNAGNLITTLIP